ncbi:hypothetical protein [Micropruina sp.]|uniref:hypothetical protein n=1 Tax=Micropruina sp. TaxID=2737536 RepID=UPI0039E60018
MSNKAKIKGHSYKPHRDIVGRIAKVVLALDRDLKNMGWKVPDPANREEYAKRRREETLRQVTELRAELEQLTQADRQLGHYTPDPLSGEALGRAQLYATQAATELAGLGGEECLKVLQQVAAVGDNERTAAYLTAARGRIGSAGLSSELSMVERQVEPQDAKVHRAFGAAANEYWAQMYWFDEHLTEALRKAELGQMASPPAEALNMEQLTGKPSAAEANWQGTRGLFLAQNDAEKAALRAFNGAIGEAGVDGEDTSAGTFSDAVAGSMAGATGFGGE